MANFNLKKTAALALSIAITAGGGIAFAHKALVVNEAAKSKTDNHIVVAASHKDLKPHSVAGFNGITNQSNIYNPAKKSVRYSDNAEVVFSEDFSLITDGTEAEPDMDMPLSSYLVDGDTFIEDSFFHTPGWWGIGAYPAGGCVGLCYPGMGGLMTTGQTDLYGNLHVKFRLKVREGNKEGKSQSLIVSVLNGDPFNPQTSTAQGYLIVNQTPEDGWQEIDLNFQNAHQGDDSMIQFNGMTYSTAGFLIDDLVVTRDYDFCLKPSNLQSWGFDNDGFTAYWQPGAENNYYELTVLEEKTIGSEDQHWTCDFESADNAADNYGLPTNLSVTSDNKDVITNENAASGSKSIKLSNNSIEIEFNGGRAYDANFLIGKGNIQDSEEPTITVDASDGFQYSRLFSISPAYMDTETYLISINEIMENEFAGKFSKIRITGSGFSENNFCLIDDIVYDASPETVTSTFIDKIMINDNRVRVTDIDPTCEYFFAVEAFKNNECSSGMTDFVHALGMPAPEAVDANNIDTEKGSFTANWTPVAKAENYILNAYSVNEIKEDNPMYYLLDDTFSDAYELEEPVSGSTIDEYTDVPGWQCGMAFIGDGNIGTFFGAQIISPELSLHNNGGEFTVKFTCTFWPENSIVVQSYENYEIITGTPDDTDTDSFGRITKDITVTFNDGKPHQQLAFYSTAMDAFFIDNVRVYQSVKAGDYTFKPYDNFIADGDSSSLNIAVPANAPGKYAYNVMAEGNYFGETYQSEHSNDVIVDMTPSGVSSLVKPLRTVIRGLNGEIELNLTENSNVEVYTADGRLAASHAANAGYSRISVPTGIYIVKANGNTSKVMVK